MWTPKNQNLAFFHGKLKEHPDPRKREQSSLIEVDPNTFDLHLSYSEGFERGPIIQRPGDGSPFMEDPVDPGSSTTDPDRQRVGTNYILDTSQREHSEWLFLAFVGNYLLFSNLPPASKENAPNPREGALNFVRQQLHDFSPNLDTADLIAALQQHAAGVPNLQTDAANMIAQCEEFLRKNEEREIFRRKQFPFFPNYKDHMGAISTRCFEVVDSLYADEYPRPDAQVGQDQSIVVTSFDINKTQPAFRAKVESLVKKYLRLFLLSRSAYSHEELARNKIKQSAADGPKPLEIVFMQGCGDLTMNMWNVAFVSGDSCHNALGWDLLHAPDEPINDRTYTCLIKWRKDSLNILPTLALNYRIVYPYQIASLAFKAPWLGKRENPERHVFLADGKQRVPIGHLIEFAVYGKQICGAADALPGEVQLKQRLRSIIQQFSDIRHVYRLPNLNPHLQFDEKETRDLGIWEYKDKPRFLFNERTADDTWLFERALIQGDRNLRVAALNQAIQFDKRDLGAPEQWIEFILNKEPAEPSDRRYTRADEAEELREGQWRWVKEGRKDWLEIFLQLNHFPCSMIGVTAEDEAVLSHDVGRVLATQRLFFVAHGHNYNRFGCTILEAARLLADAGARNILMFDEGSDVFQLVKLPGNIAGNRPKVALSAGEELTPAVPLKRRQLRCVFWATEANRIA
jgi:hypothetical protein